MTWWHIYLFTRLDSIISLSIASAIVLGILFITYLCFAFFYDGNRTFLEEDKEIQAKLQAKIPKYTVMYILLLVFTILVPSQKEAAVIYLLPKVANSEAMKEAEKLPKNVAILLNAKCQKYINETLAETVPAPESSSK